MLRPSIQDAFKDQLFDVRDNLRYHFAERGQIGTPAYEELRDTLNGYIRFVEVANFALTYRFALKLNKEPKVAERYFGELDRRFDVKYSTGTGRVGADQPGTLQPDHATLRVSLFYFQHSGHLFLVRPDRDAARGFRVLPATCFP